MESQYVGNSGSLVVLYGRRRLGSVEFLNASKKTVSDCPLPTTPRKARNLDASRQNMVDISSYFS